MKTPDHGHLHAQLSASPLSTPVPFMSIVIPTYNRPAQLTTCLEAVADLEYPSDRFEVIVVDDGGTPPLHEVVHPFQRAVTITLLRQKNTGPAAARNRGAREAKGEFLVFTDDDCAPDANWLTALATQLAASPGCAVGGHTINALPNNIYSTSSQLLIAYLYSYYNASPDQARFFTSNNLALPAAQFRALGGFDTTYRLAAGEDRELCDRWLHRGYRMVYARDAVVYHAHTLTFRTFLRQHIHYGRGAYCFHQVRARRANGRMRIEPPSFYLKMLGYPFSRTRTGWAPILALSLLTTQVAHTAGFFFQKIVLHVKPKHGQGR
jgi:GT2 family glycosyltransferase